MVALIGTAVVASSPIFLASFTLESVAMYGLVVLVIGLIAWSKYSEPPLSDPHAVAKPSRDLPASASSPDLGPVVAVPVAGGRRPTPEQP